MRNLIQTTLAAGRAVLCDEPTLDFGLCALARALDLPTGAPLVLVALGRIAVWIGHAIERSGAPSLIRPRARDTGVMP